MRLYPKKLRSIEDLEREKKLLLKESKQLEQEHLLSLQGLLGKSGSKKDKEADEKSGSILDFLPISNPLVSIGIKMAQRWFSQRKSDRKQQEAGDGDPKRKSKSPVRAIAVEVVGGYLKWKAVELSVKGVRHIIKKRRENKKEQ